MNNATTFSVGTVLLLIAFILYLLALFKVPQNDPRWAIDRVTTAQAFVVLWLLLYTADGLWNLHGYRWFW